jgi:hypothetical protein
MHLESPVRHGSLPTDCFAESLPDESLGSEKLFTVCWLPSYGKEPKVAPLRRSSSGSITAIIRWLDYADHGVASLRRSQGGSFAAIMEWLYSTDH